jgi:hypothetical protein
MRNVIYALIVVVLALRAATYAGHAEEPKRGQDKEPEPKQVKELMHRKLDNAHKMLEALAVNDLDGAAKRADELIKIRKEAAWKIVKTVEYEIWSDEFDRAAQGIIRAAKDKNLEAAKLNYLSMTMSCFHCHTYVRDLKRASVEPNLLP